MWFGLHYCLCLHNTIIVLENKPISLFEWSCCKRWFSLSKVCQPTSLCYGTCSCEQEALKLWSSVQEEGLASEARHHLLYLHKQAHAKRDIAESLHACTNWARLTACEVGVFSREISWLLKRHPPSSFSNHLNLLPMGVFWCNYESIIQSKEIVGFDSFTLVTASQWVGINAFLHYVNCGYIWMLLLRSL